MPQFGTLMAAMAVGDTALVRDMRERLAVSGPELLDMLGPEVPWELPCRVVGTCRREHCRKVIPTLFPTRTLSFPQDSEIRRPESGGGRNKRGAGGRTADPSWCLR